MKKISPSGTLVDRSLIAKELTSKMPLLLEILNNEMDAAKESFEEQEVSFLASTLLVRMR